MRIVLANKFAHLTGGADRHTLTLATVLAERGHEVRVLSTASPLNARVDGRFIELRVTHSTRGHLGPAMSLLVAAEALWNRSAAAAMRQLIESFQPDVLHIHKLYPQLSVAPVVVASAHGIPVVQTVHDFEMVAANPLDSKGRALDHDEERRAYRALNNATFVARRFVHRRRVDAWVAVSGYLAESLASRGIAATVIPNFAAKTAKPVSFVDREGALYVGRLSPEKGVNDLLDLARRRPQLPVSIAGDGPLESELRALAKDLPNVAFAGRVAEEDVPDLIAGHRVVVLPSHCDEGGPLAAVESMAAGTPVVGYARGGLGEYIRDAGAGAAVEDLGELIAETVALASDETRWNVAAAHGATAARTRHSPEAHAAALELLYERTIAGERLVLTR